jgi:hypothetical protein
LAYVFNEYPLKTIQNLNIYNIDQTVAITLLKKMLAWQNYWSEINSSNREREIINTTKSLKKKGYDNISHKGIKHCMIKINKSSKLHI